MLTLVNLEWLTSLEQAEINASCHLLAGQMVSIVPAHPTP